ncbi:hypothetical protein A3A46_01910 [Candidatus Roizmanbacteria bacterium RIFCSPLOWO2_01_FULL_37_13]|nr:MAG: hypothetical protein A3A46_01910 [Candidatus Roizmanbacteria bacterium RIFCSPLOWO2_01_FULL_37_13]
MNIAGIILAAGKGTRIKSKDRNKVTLPFLNKPLIIYAVELLSGVANPVVVVVGAFYESVKDALRGHTVVYTHQRKRLGTAHAAKVGLKKMDNYSPTPEMVLISYGDHAMFYSKETVLKLIDLHKTEKAVMSIITTSFDSPNSLAWGRIIRKENNYIVDIVEQKDATQQQLKIKELNAGFYCFDFNFLKNNIKKIKKSKVSGEYYLTDLVKIAADQRNKVVGLKVHFSGVGIGINRYDELEESQKIYVQRGKD